MHKAVQCFTVLLACILQCYGQELLEEPLIGSGSFETLLNLSSPSQLPLQLPQSDSCLPCRLQFANLTELLRLQKELKQQIDELSVIEVLLTGVTFNRTLDDALLAYDPNWWAWVRSPTEYYFSVPALDMDVTSFGLLSQTVAKVEIEIEAYPAGCSAELSNQCREQRTAILLLQLLQPLRKQHLSKRTSGACECNKAAAQDEEELEHEAQETADLLCASSMLQTKAFPWLGPVLVGWRCLPLTQKTINTVYSQAFVSKALTPQSHQSLRLALFCIGTLLPVVLFLNCFLYQPFPMDILYRKMNKFAMFAEYHPSRTLFFRLLRNTKITESANQTATCGHWLVVHQNALVDYGSSAHFLRLWQRLHLSSLKLLAIFGYLFVHLLVIYWLVQYQQKKNQFANLTSSSQVLVNLFTVPLAWLFTPGIRWPFLFSLAFVGVYLLAFLPLSIWLLADTIFFLTRRCRSRKDQMHYRDRWMAALRRHLLPLVPSKLRAAHKGHRDFARVCSTIFLRNLLRFYLAVSVVLLYVVVYCVFHSAIYVLLGVIVHLEYTAPLLTGVFMSIYYIAKCVHRLTASYSQVKSLLFEFAVDENNMKYEAIRCDVPTECELRRTVETQENGERPACTLEEADKCGPQAVWLPQVVFKDEEGGDPRVTFKQFREVATKFKPFGVCLRQATARLAFTLLFIGLLIFTVLAFKSNVYQNSTDILITSLISLLSALLPQVSELFRTEEDEKLKEDAFAYNVQNYLTKQLVEYFLVTSSDCSCPDLHVRQHPTANHSVPEMQHDELDKVNKKSSEVPVLLNYLPPSAASVSTSSSRTRPAVKPIPAPKPQPLLLSDSLLKARRRAEQVLISPSDHQDSPMSPLLLTSSATPRSITSTKFSVYDNSSPQIKSATAYATIGKRPSIPPPPVPRRDSLVKTEVSQV